MNVDGAPQQKRFWWVNQNQTYEEERAGGFMWSPKRNRNGARNQFYDNMLGVRHGDVVFSFRRQLIGDIGIVQGPAQPSPKPDFGAAGEAWDDDGWMVPVEFRPVRVPFRPKEHIEDLRDLLPAKYSPLRANGDGLQSVYLALVNPELAMALLALADERDVSEPLHDLVQEEPELSAEMAMVPDRMLSETQRRQVVLARRGQGLFKANLRLRESRCRVTGTIAIEHLRASHIKPWSQSTNEERLDGDNGLLLAPHVDHLFDYGWISFDDDGRLLISPELAPEVVSRWHLTVDDSPRPLNAKQRHYLQYHRAQVYRSGARGSATASDR